MINPLCVLLALVFLGGASARRVQNEKVSTTLVSVISQYVHYDRQSFGGSWEAKHYRYFSGAEELLLDFCLSSNNSRARLQSKIFQQDTNPNFNRTGFVNLIQL